MTELRVPSPPATLQLSPQGWLLAALALVVGIVLGAPHQPAVAVALVLVISLLAYIVQARLRRMLLRSLVVLPVVGLLTLFWPLRQVQHLSWGSLITVYAQNWPQMLAFLLTPWLCVLTMMLLVEVCPQADLLYALQRLHLPRILILLLSFIYRYISILRRQLRAMQRALIARAPTLSRRRQALFYGNLAGAPLVRSYDRGERIHAAMLARGFTGRLPRLQKQRLGLLDAALISGAMLLALALVWI